MGIPKDRERGSMFYEHHEIVWLRPLVPVSWPKMRCDRVFVVSDSVEESLHRMIFFSFVKFS